VIERAAVPTIEGLMPGTGRMETAAAVLAGAETDYFETVRAAAEDDE
jgi:hypothetical protein